MLQTRRLSDFSQRSTANPIFSSKNFSNGASGEPHFSFARTVLTPERGPRNGSAVNIDILGAKAMDSGQPLEIEFPLMRYDITMPLLEGRVAVEGVKLKPVKSSSMINKEDPKMKAGDFGLCDLNIGYLLPAIESGWEIIGLPVFSKRKPVYQLVFCHADSGIRSPKDLQGKRIGSRTFRTPPTLWARGLLQDRYGVDLSKLQWVVQAQEVFPVHDQTARIDYVDGKKSMIERLISGEIDALITDISDTQL